MPYQHAAWLASLLQPRSLRIHRRLFATTMLILLAFDLFAGDGWTTFWPMFCLILMFAVHSFVVRSLHVDDAWVAERMLDTRRGSYDVSHILDIESRRDAGDASVMHPEERQWRPEERQRRPEERERRPER